MGDQIKQTSDNVKSSLKQIQQHAQVDYETRRMLTAAHKAYRSHADREGRSPSSWQELETVHRRIGSDVTLMREMKKAGYIVNWDISTESLRNPQAVPVLAFQKEVESGAGWVLLADGQIVQWTSEQFRNHSAQ